MFSFCVRCYRKKDKLPCIGVCQHLSVQLASNWTVLQIWFVVGMKDNREQKRISGILLMNFVFC